MIGERLKLKIYTNSQKCISCGVCEKNCTENAIESVNSIPFIARSKCINFYQCIYNCPVKALSIFRSKNKT